ncbi:MAG: twin-arginine translocase TatA/TatE family subunit [Chlorobi bacterium]|nr:twin-arginine translocase TatA/TatE family subunit [Chlorobiota bacterium]
MIILFISGGEVIFILLAVLLLFGADKLPEIARTIGKGIKQFKDAAEDIKNEVSKEENDVVDDLKEIKKTAEDIKKNVKKYKIFENND